MTHDPQAMARRKASQEQAALLPDQSSIYKAVVEDDATLAWPTREVDSQRAFRLPDTGQVWRLPAKGQLTLGRRQLRSSLFGAGFLLLAAVVLVVALQLRILAPSRLWSGGRLGYEVASQVNVVVDVFPREYQSCVAGWFNLKQLSQREEEEIRGHDEGMTVRTLGNDQSPLQFQGRLLASSQRSLFDISDNLRQMAETSNSVCSVMYGKEITGGRVTLHHARDGLHCKLLCEGSAACDCYVFDSRRQNSCWLKRKPCGDILPPNAERGNMVSGICKVQGCIDFPAHWRSRSGHSCAEYDRRKWCANGKFGHGWDRPRALGDFDNWTVDYNSALEACCVCGGGRRTGTTQVPIATKTTTTQPPPVVGGRRIMRAKVAAPSELRDSSCDSFDYTRPEELWAFHFPRACHLEAGGLGLPEAACGEHGAEPALLPDDCGAPLPASSKECLLVRVAVDETYLHASVPGASWATFVLGETAVPLNATGRSAVLVAIDPLTQRVQVTSTYDFLRSPTKSNKLLASDLLDVESDAIVLLSLSSYAVEVMTDDAIAVLKGFGANLGSTDTDLGGLTMIGSKSGFGAKMQRGFSLVIEGTINCGAFADSGATMWVARRTHIDVLNTSGAQVLVCVPPTSTTTTITETTTSTASTLTTMTSTETSSTSTFSTSTSTLTTATTTRPSWWSFPALFCFMVTRGIGYEPDLVRWQVAQTVGIFYCDEFAVYSEAGVIQLGTTKKGVHVQTVAIPPMSGGMGVVGIGGQTTSSWLNAWTFMQTWDAVSADGRFRKMDWTVKTDPDCVFFPERLRPHLAPHTPRGGAALYIRNCGKASDIQFYGSIEVISSNAFDTYINNKGRCMAELPWHGWGEDYFMQHCLDFLHVGFVVDYGILGDGNCWGAPCGNGAIAAFHPFKSVGLWQNCHTASLR